MFWRFGSDDDSRPVAATAWWNVVCRRPVARRAGARQRLDVGRAELGVQPPVEEHGDHRVRRRAGPRAPTRRSRSRSWCACPRQVELVEQHLLELLGAAEVNWWPTRRRSPLEPRRSPSRTRGEARPAPRGRWRRRSPPCRASTGMSGSSSSSSSRSSAGSSSSARASGSRTAAAASASTAGLVDGGSSPGRRQLDVEPLGADVGERLAAQRGIEDVGRDLGVERDPRQRPAPAGSRSVGSRRASSQTSSGLTSWPTSGTPVAVDQLRAAPTAPSVPRATTRPSAPVTASPGSVPRARAAGRRTRPRRSASGCAPSQSGEAVDAVGRDELEPPVGSRERGPEQVRRPIARGPTADLERIGPAGALVGLGGRRRPPTGRSRGSAAAAVAADRRGAGRPARPPAWQAVAGDASRRTVPLAAAARAAAARGRLAVDAPAAARRASGTRTPGTAG